MEAGSGENREGDGRTIHYRERIIEGEIAPGKRGCTVYLTHAEDTGQGLPRRVSDDPYNVWTLCQGGLRVTGGSGYPSLAVARRVMRTKLR